MFNRLLNRRSLFAGAALAVGASAAPPPDPDAALLADLAEFRRLLPGWIAAERAAKGERDRFADPDAYFASPLFPLREAMLALQPRLLAARPVTVAGAVALLAAAEAIEAVRREGDAVIWLCSPARELIAAALPPLRLAYGPAAA